MVDLQHKPGFVGELLQLDLPEPHARTIGAAAVRRDRQLACEQARNFAPPPGGDNGPFVHELH